MTRILLTGAAGSLGRALVPALASAGFDVGLLDRAIDPAHDLVDGPVLDAMLPDCDGVIHLAGCARVACAEADPPRARRDNVDATAVLLRAVRSQEARPWLIFASSREVYGRSPAVPVREDAPLRPQNVYGATKAEAEGLVAAAVATGLRAVTLRLANVYGAPWDHPDRLVPAFVRAALAGTPLVVHGEGRSLDLLHFRDAVGAFVAAAKALAGGHTGMGPLNVCSGVETPLDVLATAIVTQTRSVSVIRRAVSSAHEVHRFVGDNAAARLALSWAPTVPLHEGLATLVDATRHLVPLPNVGTQ